MMLVTLNIMMFTSLALFLGQRLGSFPLDCREVKFTEDDNKFIEARKQHFRSTVNDTQHHLVTIAT